MNEAEWEAEHSGFIAFCFVTFEQADDVLFYGYEFGVGEEVMDFCEKFVDEDCFIEPDSLDAIAAGFADFSDEHKFVVEPKWVEWGGEWFF